MTEQRCGLVAIVGRPNVGKSTLLNHILEQKISITSRKPQTTRHRILGIKTDARVQCIYVDTPGMHKSVNRVMNRKMNSTVSEVLDDVDLVVFMTDRTIFNEEDEMVLERLQRSRVPVLLVINKCDLVKDKDRLLPHIERLSRRYPFAEIIPTSVLRSHNMDAVERSVRDNLPEGPFLFPEDQVTDRSQRFLAAEMIREKVTRQLGDELPYDTAVEIEQFSEDERLVQIHGLVLVDKPGQKQIIIGRGGERLKRIGMAARKDMEQAFEKKVMLHLWVKVRAGWADDERALQSLS